MHTLKVATAALNQTPLDWDGNQRNIEAVLAAARAQGVAVLCLPELCITGYGCEDAFLGPGTTDRAWEVLQAVLPQTKGMLVCLGLPIERRGGLYNCACLAVDGKIAGFVAKEHLPGDGLYYEPRWFKPWPADQVVQLERDGETYPFGDLLFDVGGLRIGFEICEDAWVVPRRAADVGVSLDLVLNPSASHFAFGKREVRERLVLEGSRSMMLGYLYANLLGNEAGRVIYDGHCLIAQGGELLAHSTRLKLVPFELTTATMDIEATRYGQARKSSFKADTELPRQRCVQVDFEPARAKPQKHQVILEAWERGGHVKEEEFTRAITLGLFDYMRKSQSHGFVLSLSGGADSTATACLVHLMVQRALLELGPQRGPELLGVPGMTSAEQITGELLCCAYQSTRNSGDVTRNAAQTVAAAIGANFLHLDVQPLVDGYTTLIEQAIDQKLTWENHDLTLQNIQARVRAPSVWMLANLRRALLLSTSNRSEAAVGYATMDGDTAGGLSPIAGIDKAFLRDWLRWLEQIGPDGLTPIPAVAAVNVQTPTAELRPRDQNQTDEDDLMPYPVLDAIEDFAIGDKQPPKDCLAMLIDEFPQYEENQLKHWVKRFFQLWSRNQWKRERYAPSFHVDDKNLDPKTWCRFPILSGGFERELREL